MNTLNADCLREIIIHLNLKDQIALLQVNRNFQQIVRSLWMVKYRKNRINFLEHALDEQEIDLFFKTIKDFAETLELRFLDEHKYALLKRYTYPCVKTVRLTIHPCFIKDEDIKDFHRIFPNLMAFSPHGNLTGQYLDLWPNLKELNLSYCYKLELDLFHNIMKSLKLEHLELNMFPVSKRYEQLDLKEAHLANLKYLRLNTYEFYYFLAQPLPGLKDLIITNQYNPRQLFDVILSVWKAKDIRKLETANVENVLANCLEMHMNVGELSIISDRNVLPVNVLRSLHLLDDLRVLRFKNCNLCSVDLMELLKSVPQIDEISVENCRLAQEHLQLNVLDLVGERSKLLRLNFWQNLGHSYENDSNCVWKNPTYVDVNLRGNHHFFELTEKPGPDLCFEPLYIQFR